jgi:uncharacterized membrane protein YdjX (TVP38/TMEM64 family)
MYIFGTVRMCLLYVIMMIRMTFPVVPSTKKTATIGNSYGLLTIYIFLLWSVSVSVNV